MASYMIRSDGDEDPRDLYPMVPRVTAACAWCQQQNSRIFGRSRDGRIAYHRCLSCGRKFRSREVPAPPLADEKK
jgi:hypothetical protein